MKALLLAALFIPHISLASPEVVYGADNRLDPYMVKSAALKQLAASTAGMINLANFKKGSKTGLFDLLNTKTHAEKENLCTSERFGDQIVAPICSGFLIAPDVLLTAGHCYKLVGEPDQVCKSYAWVFDYKMNSAKSNPTKNIPVSNVYLCKKVLAAELTKDLDFSIIKLDRPVVGRAPVKLRTSGKVSGKESLVVIGHPSGLPQKISPNGRVTDNSQKTTFATNLDTFHGNSGSAVFDAATGTVEGILVQGKTDYVPSNPSIKNSCMVVNVCKDDGKTCTTKEPEQVAKGENVIRITAIASQIQAALKAK